MEILLGLAVLFVGYQLRPEPQESEAEKAKKKEIQDVKDTLKDMAFVYYKHKFPDAQADELIKKVEDLKL
jgi:hypothetical protein